MRFRNQQIYAAAFAAIEAGKAIMSVYGTDDFQVETKEDDTPLTLADQKAHHTIASFLKPLGLPILSEEGKQMPFDLRKGWDSFWLVDPLDGTKEFIKRNGEFTVNIALIEKGLPVLGIIYVPVSTVLYLGEVGSGAWRIQLAELPESIEDIVSCIGQKLPANQTEEYAVVASRTHTNKETGGFIEEIQANRPNVKLVSRGSSLKLCMIAEGEANIYPRFAPTMEWDTAAGHAICKASGAMVLKADDPGEELTYNKESLINPWFIARRPEK